jgi:hypothetical protein
MIENIKFQIYRLSPAHPIRGRHLIFVQNCTDLLHAQSVANQFTDEGQSIIVMAEPDMDSIWKSEKELVLEFIDRNH